MSGTQWPFPDPLWPDSPWTMEGTVITAWFNADEEALARLAHPDFTPETVGRQARLRFYDIKASSNGESIPFKEAVLAFRTSFAGVPGELSAKMWTDSIPYLCWGREVFGWPLRHDEIRLSGPAWSGEQGGAECAVQSTTLTVNTLEDRISGSGDPSTWLTPHRVVGADPNEPERRVVYAVTPSIIQAGERFRCSGDVDVSGILGDVQDVAIDIVRGVKIEVGSRVEIIHRS